MLGHQAAPLLAAQATEEGMHLAARRLWSECGEALDQRLEAHSLAREVSRVLAHEGRVRRRVAREGLGAEPFLARRPTEEASDQRVRPRRIAGSHQKGGGAVAEHL